MTVKNLGYLLIQMRDPGEWLALGREVLGFDGSTDAQGRVRLRMDDAPFRYLIVPGDEDRFLRAGWELSPADYATSVEALRQHDALVSEGELAESEVRSLESFVVARDPSGNEFELFCNRSATQPGFVSPLPGLEFIAGALGLGHLVLPAAEHAATTDFYQQLLGFGMSDALTLPPPAEGAPEMCINFMHAGNARHHSLALFNGPAPSGVVHVMTEMHTLDAVGQCLDRVHARGLPVVTTLGRHLNDQMVSFYFLAPGGIPMEVGYDGLLVDWEGFTPTISSSGDVWGHIYDFPG